MSEPTLYRINPEPHDDHDGSYTGGLPDPISFLVDDGVLVPVEPTVIVKVGEVWDDEQYLPHRFERGTLVALVAIGTWKEEEPA